MPSTLPACLGTKVLATGAAVHRELAQLARRSQVYLMGPGVPATAGASDTLTLCPEQAETGSHREKVP